MDVRYVAGRVKGKWGATQSYRKKGKGAGLAERHSLVGLWRAGGAPDDLHSDRITAVVGPLGFAGRWATGDHPCDGNRRTDGFG